MDVIDLKQIRCFAAAYEEGSFSMAAKREYCTQPGLSVYIRRLEEMVGHRLFDRKARGVTPTIAGRHFYSCCVDVLNAVRVAKERMLDMSGSVASKIDIGISPSVAKGVLPSVVSDYVATHPYVDIRLSEAYSATLTDWVLSGEVQAAIGTKPPAHLGLETSHFFRERLVLVRRANGESTPKKQPARSRPLRELEGMKLILPSPKHNLRQVLDSCVRLGASAPGKVLEIDGLLATFEVVQNSDWATVVPKMAVMDEVRKGKLVAEPITEPQLWLDYNVVRTKDTILPTACRQFLDLLRGKLEQLSRGQ
ncbi:MAG TPA: LysR family transcriptional regulator [Candidatus Dormibacteraeota bacterium]|nr:LysR family transcriptional regulator [Candidatus Dormibacteraeota bacterium]